MQHKQQHTHRSPQPSRTPHRVRRQPHSQINDNQINTHNTHAHRAGSKGEINLIFLQVNLNGIKSKLEELKLLIHYTHAYIITIRETEFTPKAKSLKVHNFTTVRIDSRTRQEVGSSQSLETT